MEKVTGVREIIKNNFNSNKGRLMEKVMPKAFLLAASISIITTIGIAFTLVFDAYKFFSKVPFKDIFSTRLAPLASTPAFGILPLINGTIIIALIAMSVAIPVGLTSAIYLSEYASENIRRTLKPIMEVLAGIPTIVYGFFAYSFVTPLLMKAIPSLEAKNALSPGIVMGIMIIPLVASLSEDAMNSVPNSLREGALALGSTKLEVALKVIVPAGFSGIIASFVLGISRAVGETMIVAIASGSSKNFTFDITKSMQTMTAYIVEFTSGDAGSGTLGYYSLYAVGLLLFIFTLLMNLLAQYISKRYREEY
ncbi:phosphate ABC transporter permease subunit PstC [Alkaliphilus peptidifermentans]|uniref:Phosphate transport system permease protein n=1 Tax=Alkaliphilus peptidifermentans DSM 18978 TaxID=1120976 RepID=A0A1G5FN77_9FIRM|nr:phosphate ABC transporter permease subunit PstC [Alkaliphilus peptidifermentans]SCY40735.1 phosphate ABC transporter membrane protein 1, PhoT family (TC 3.A.1.7.1) [Alkaliphilus peptidifermentans DSM 18978]